MGFKQLLDQSLKKNIIDEKIHSIFLQLYTSYASSIHEAGMDMKEHDHLFETFLDRVEHQLASPYTFQPYHERITAPFDYYHFGIEFIRPLVDLEHSYVWREENVRKIESQLAAGENVILFANHQTEVDPQLMSIVLEKNHPKIATGIIFVAGDRVITDPMAIPFSMGRNLLCIYSKRHIDNPPEKKYEKQQHNQRTMKLMKELFAKGGKCIYVAPSGGRDRENEKGVVELAPFDPNSIEMFRLMAKQSGRTTHFYPLTLVTYSILPPPKSIESAVGEHRSASREGARFGFGDEIDMSHYPGCELPNRHARRESLAGYIWDQVNANYTQLKQGIL